MQRERIASLEGTEIIYTGLRLSQDHLSVWECLVHIAKAQQLGDKCVVSTYQVLKLLGKKDTGGNFISTKSDTKNHGIGLQSVTRIVEAYGGVMEVLTERSVFQVNILM